MVFIISSMKVDMTGSFVFAHFEFLKNLGVETNEHSRIMLIRQMHVNTMKALSKVIAFILNNTVPTLSYDQRIFRENRNVLRHIISPIICLSRKKRTLERYNKLIPRLLREQYIINTCLHELRQTLNLV